jgi:hypothetical protein
MSLVIFLTVILWLSDARLGIFGWETKEWFHKQAGLGMECYLRVLVDGFHVLGQRFLTYRVWNGPLLMGQ